MGPAAIIHLLERNNTQLLENFNFLILPCINTYGFEHNVRGNSDGIDILRNCSCGTTLMAVFNERRDMSGRGIELREKFAQLLTIITSSGLDKVMVRRELLKMLRTLFEAITRIWLNRY